MAGGAFSGSLFLITLLLTTCNTFMAMAGTVSWADRSATRGGGGGALVREVSTARGGAAAKWSGYYGGGQDEMVEEATRRVLGDTSDYISYSVLTADAVPCSTAGASYYDCAGSTAANPYTRSCTTITLCARDTS